MTNEEAFRSRNYYIYEQIEKGRSYASVGREFGVTRERIRQVYLKERRKKENDRDN